jgi:hypothetical protein
LRKGESEARDWAFLAMAHARMGRSDEARKWLNRFSTFKVPDSPHKFWEQEAVKCLHEEALAVVLYDTVFPPNPFAR